MNNLFKRRRSRKNGAKNLVISVVILLEVIALLIVATYAWVETVSSIKIKSNSNETHTVDTFVFTDATIGGSQGTINLADYFKQSGDMHLAPASSADGTTFFFPMVNNAAGDYSAYDKYRKGNTSDKNTTYLSATFRLQADENTDIFFTTTPAVAVNNDIRVSVTFQSKGSNTPPVTKIFANKASTTQVVNSTSGTKGATRVYTFASHRKGGTKIFDIGADETKIVTINVWLQKNPSNNDDLTQNMSASRAITSLGLISDLTPRIVTLIPTSEWDTSGTNEYFYAYCWSDSTSVHDRLYSITLNQETEHYSFEYNGKYDHTLFIRSGNANLVSNASDSPYFTDYLANHWNDNTVWNKTEDTAIPDISKIVNPTFYITTINGSTQQDNSSGTDSTAKKSTGLWVKNASNVDVAPVTINLAHVDTQSDTWGTVSAKSFIGTNTSTHELEATNDTNASALHHSTIHAIPGKMLQLKATAKTNYRFVGWYDNPEGIDNSSGDNDKHLLSTQTTYSRTVPAEVEVTYYAKFIETRTLTIKRLVDNNSTSTAAAGTITIDSSTSAKTATSHFKTVDKGETVTFKATAETGYTLEGIYTAATDGTLKYGPGNGSTIPAVPSDYPNAAGLTLDGNTPITTYFARFTTNTHIVNLRTIGSTGSTVQYGSETAATSVTKTGVKYNTSVTIKANPAIGYKFVGWYDNASGTGTAKSTNASYTFTLGDADVTYYAKFEEADFYLTGYINGSDYSGTAYKFTKSSGTTYTYTITFTDAHATTGCQYVTIYDGTNAYHPATHESGSGTVGSTVNTSPTDNPKWLVDAPSGSKVTFTWDTSTQTLSWTIKYYLYFKTSTNFGYSGTTSNRHIYFVDYGTTGYWDDSNGSGSKGYTVREMSYNSTKQLYYYEFSSKPTFTHLSFVKHSQSNYQWFYETNVAYRGDFDIKTPVYTAPSSNNTSLNSTGYYNNGSWGKYN